MAASASAFMLFSISAIFCQTQALESDSCSDPDTCDTHHAPVIQLSACNTDCGRVELYDTNTKAWTPLCYESIENEMDLSQNICEIVGFDKRNRVYSISKEASNMTETDLCIYSTQIEECFQSKETIRKCLQSDAFHKRQISGSTLLGLSCRAANKVKLPEDYFTPESIPFGIHFLNLFNAEAAKLNNAGSETYTFDDTAYEWLKVHNNNVRSVYKYSTDFLAQHGMINTAAAGDIDMDAYHYNMAGINLNALYDTLNITSVQTDNDFANLQSIRNTIFNNVDNKIREFQWSDSWGTASYEYKLHALYHWVLDSAFRKQNYYDWALKHMIPSDDSVARSIYDQLHYDGIAMIDDWGLSSSTMNELVKVYEDTVAGNDATKFSSTSNGAVITVRRENEWMEEYLSTGNMSLVNAIKAYLGGEVLLSGYKITKLTNSLGGKEDYHAGLWHHDRVGRRLKLFIFLNDIDCDEGRPTLVAQGTNLMEYWRASTYPSSRFNDEFVTDKYNIMKGCGQRGGGFIFDTHTIHRAGVELKSEHGVNERLTVIAEYHNVVKCHLNDKYNLKMPCPSGDQYIVNRVF